jgi:DNA-binding MarR family transcriptional regulator
MLNDTGWAQRRAAIGDAPLSSDVKQSLRDEEKRKLRALLAALEPFRKLRSTMPMQYIVSFLLVALDEGEGVTEYARQAGVSQTVMSRHLLDIGARNRHMEDGFGLVDDRQDPMNLSKHQKLLTPKGRTLALEILRALENAK